MVPRPTLVKFFTGKSGKTVCSASISVWAIAAHTWEHHSLSVFWNWKDFPTINHTPALPKANICAVKMTPDCGRDHGFHPKTTLSARSQDPDPLSATLSPWDSNRIILSNRYVQQNVGFSSICYSLRVAFSPLVFSPHPTYLPKSSSTCTPLCCPRIQTPFFLTCRWHIFSNVTRQRHCTRSGMPCFPYSVAYFHSPSEIVEFSHKFLHLPNIFFPTQTIQPCDMMKPGRNWLLQLFQTSVVSFAWYLETVVSIK